MLVNFKYINLELFKTFKRIDMGKKNDGVISKDLGMRMQYHYDLKILVNIYEDPRFIGQETNK